MSRSRTATPGHPESVGDLLSGFLERKGLAGRVEAASVLTDWAARVGAQVAAVTEPLRVNEGTLFVAVATSAWMNELDLMKGEFLRRVNAGRTEGRIERIVFQMAGGAPPATRGGG